MELDRANLRHSSIKPNPPARLTGWIRYLKASGKSFEVDLGKLADEARFDGISVLRTNARITPLQAVIRYRDLLQVEALFRMAKASFDTRPIFHHPS